MGGGDHSMGANIPRAPTLPACLPPSPHPAPELWGGVRRVERWDSLPRGDGGSPGSR